MPRWLETAWAAYKAKFVKDGRVRDDPHDYAELRGFTHVCTSAAGTETVVAYTPQVAMASIAANPDDPKDLVGIEVQARMVDAVAKVLTVALRDAPARGFTPPSQALALGAAPPIPGN